MSKPKKFKMKKCPWELMKENNQGALYWCEKCGAVYNDRETEEPSLGLPSALDISTLYCPDQGLFP